MTIRGVKSTKPVHPDGEILIPSSELKDIFPGTTDQYWAIMRHKGTGPAYVKTVRKVFYRRTDIDAWIDANTKIRPDKPVNA